MSELTDDVPVTTPKTNYLVFEGIETSDGRGRLQLQFNAPPMLIRAANPHAAGMKWMRRTKRLSKYIVVEAFVVDFTVPEEDEDDDMDYDPMVNRQLTP